jgi:hypothetical protein
VRCHNFFLVHVLMIDGLSINSTTSTPVQCTTSTLQFAEVVTVLPLNTRCRRCSRSSAFRLKLGYPTFSWISKNSLNMAIVSI